MFRAVVRFEVESSSIWRNPALSDQRLREVLEIPPAVEWSPPPRANHPSSDLELLILERLLASAGLGAELPHIASPARFKAAIAAKYPLLDPALHNGDRDQYASHRLVFAIDADGCDSLTLTLGTLGAPLPGLVHAFTPDGKPEFVVYLQEVVRADLLARIAAVREQAGYSADA